MGITSNAKKVVHKRGPGGAAPAETGKTTDKQRRDAALTTLAAKANKGDKTALEDLCTEIGRQVLYTVRMISGCGETDTEDIAQEALTYLCEHIHDLRDPQAFRAWLSRIVTNQVRIFRRKNAPHGKVLHLDEYLQDIPDDEAVMPLECFLREEEAAAIQELISTLPARQREALMLHYYEGLTATETAKVMGLAHSNVLRYLALARDKLKNELKKRGNIGVLAMLPMGSIIKEALEISAGKFALQDAFISRQLAIKAMQQAAAKSVATTGKSLLAPLASIAASVAVAVGAIWGANAQQAPPPPAPPASVSQVVAPASFSGGIVFSGGEDRGEENAWLNPTGATLNAQSPNGALTVKEWWITPADDADTILYSGAGEDGVGEALIRLQSRSGVYMLHFRMNDEIGHSYMCGQNFWTE